MDFSVRKLKVGHAMIGNLGASLTPSASRIQHMTVCCLEAASEKKRLIAPIRGWMNGWMGSACCFKKVVSNFSNKITKFSKIHSKKHLQ